LYFKNAYGMKVGHHTVLGAVSDEFGVTPLLNLAAAPPPPPGLDQKDKKRKKADGPSHRAFLVSNIKASQ
jgi:hypothetical protein